MSISCYGQTKKEINWNDSLPKNIITKIKRKYINYQINYASYDKLKNQYAIILIKKHKEINLLYDSNGKLLDKQKSIYYTSDGSDEKPTYKNPFPNL
jgi:hypothetical protein